MTYSIAGKQENKKERKRPKLSLQSASTRLRRKCTQETQIEMRVQRKKMTEAKRSAPKQTTNKDNVENAAKPKEAPLKAVEIEHSVIEFVHTLLLTVWPYAEGTESLDQPTQMPLLTFVKTVLLRSHTPLETLHLAMLYILRLRRNSHQNNLRRQEMALHANYYGPPVPCLNDVDCEVGNLSELITLESVISPTNDFPPIDFCSDIHVMRPEIIVAMAYPLGCPRRGLLISLILANKYLNDKSYSNRAWGTITGLSPLEISRLELEFLNAIEHRLNVPAKVFQEFGVVVAKGWKTNTSAMYQKIREKERLKLSRFSTQRRNSAPSIYSPSKKRNPAEICHGYGGLPTPGTVLS